MRMQQESELRSELQRLLSLLHMQTSIYNVETRIGKNGKPYIMEVSPRGGGNRLAEMVRYSTGMDMITAAVRAAVGDPIGEVVQQPLNGHWAEVILHSQQDGTFQELSLSEEIKPFVYQEDLWVKPEDKVSSFIGANDAIGTLVLKCHTEEQLIRITSQLNIHISVAVK